MATCREWPGLEDDERLVLPELDTWGIVGEPVIWDDPAVDWASYDLTVVRSTWDYVDRRDEFVAWAESVPRLANPASVVHWNTDKRYLRDLAALGLPVTPTEWIGPGDEVRLPAAGVHVVKPSVGAGSRDAGRFDLGDQAEFALAVKHAEHLVERGDTVIVQPYLEAVDSYGETALLYFGGSFSHAIRKAALLSGPDTEVDGLYRIEKISPRQPSEAELMVGERILSALPVGRAQDLLYARVDVVPDESGQPVLLELELTEPSLFLAHGDGAASRFAAAIGTHLDRVLKTG